MATLSIESFGGVIPKLAPHLLPNGAAAVNINVIPIDGNLHGVSYAAPLTPVNSQPVSATGTLSSLYVSAGGVVWGWEAKVRVARIPSGNAPQRYFYTGDAAPRVFDDDLGAHRIAAGSLVPPLSYAGGLPRPKETPTLVVGDGENVPAADAALPNLYAYSFYVRWGGLAYESNLSEPLSAARTATVRFGVAAPTLNRQDIASFEAVDGVTQTYRMMLSADHYVVVGDRVALGNYSTQGSVVAVGGDRDITVRFDRDVFLNTMDVHIRRQRAALVLRNDDGEEANVFYREGMKNPTCRIHASVRNAEGDYDIFALPIFSIEGFMDSTDLAPFLAYKAAGFAGGAPGSVDRATTTEAERQALIASLSNADEQERRRKILPTDGVFELTDTGDFSIVARRRGSVLQHSRRIYVEHRPLVFLGQLMAVGGGAPLY